MLKCIRIQWHVQEPYGVKILTAIPYQTVAKRNAGNRTNVSLVKVGFSEDGCNQSFLHSCAAPQQSNEHHEIYWPFGISVCIVVLIRQSLERCFGNVIVKFLFEGFEFLPWIVNSTDTGCLFLLASVDESVVLPIMWWRWRRSIGMGGSESSEGIFVGWRAFRAVCEYWVVA